MIRWPCVSPVIDHRARNRRTGHSPTRAARSLDPKFSLQSNFSLADYQSKQETARNVSVPTSRLHDGGLVIILALAVVIAFSLPAPCAHAQERAMIISPDKATMLVGERHTFRAVGKDGRIRHNVRWGISPQNAAVITVNGDDVTVEAREASPSVLLTASAEADSADASIEIRSSGDMPAGTLLWSVSPTPGCKAAKITQAVPSANGPDLYVEETCPEGSMIRALTADGRELWRRRLGSSGRPGAVAVPVAQGPYIGFLPNGASSRVSSKPDEPAREHIGQHPASVCDAIQVGMTRDDALRTVTDHKVTLDTRQRQSDTWQIEEAGSLCAISFDAKAARVVKKKKTIVTE